MKLRYLMLAAAAGATGVTGAQAADLPVAPEPVDYVRICDAYGTGFFFIPGTDTCLRVSGRVRTDFYFNNMGDDAGGTDGWQERNENGTSTRARGYIYLDSRTNTEYGLLRTYTDLYFTADSGTDLSTTLDQAFIQFGAFTFGKTGSFYDFYTGSAYGKLDRNWSDHKTWLVGYTAAFGNGLSASLSVEDGTYSEAGVYVDSSDSTDDTTITWGYAGHRFPDLVAALRVDQGWGSAQIMGALHEARLGHPTISGTLTDATTMGYMYDDAKVGWAIGAGVTYMLPMLAPGDNINFQANYVDGALKYVNVSSRADIYATPSKAKTSKAWNFGGGFTHNWTPHWQTNIDGSYVDVDAPTSAGQNDMQRWTIAGNLVWMPISGFQMGGELQYANTKYKLMDDADEVVGMLRVERTF